MFKRIISATDGSKEPDRALTLANSLAFEQGATLTIAHVAQKMATSGDHALDFYANES